MTEVPRITNTPLAYLSLFLLSASVLCFEIVSTRIASVIFVQDYAFITLSLALLGIASGSVFSYYRIKASDDPSRIVYRALVALGALLCFFVAATVELSITSPLLFFVLVFLPFSASGVAYAQIYKAYAAASFTLYASDLTGAAVGSLASLGLIGFFGAPNSIIVVALVAFVLASLSLHHVMAVRKRVIVYAVLAACFGALIVNGRNEFLGMVPIGYFPEKDFYFVYPNAAATAKIIDSRWSIYGRSDLVQYSDQDMVQQLFVDGAAGTQVYRFNGNIQHTQSILQSLLLHNTNAIPCLCLNKDEKRSMLVIGPGGGKEVLLGLFGEAGAITGVEVNPDFVNIVKDHKEFDGGVYTNFPNVKIIVEEGRHYVKQSSEAFDLVVMALPSTAQMQNIEPFATSENYLLTKEAIRDYLSRVGSEGKLIFTVHNAWELERLIATAVSVFQDLGVPRDEIRNHFVVFEADYAPTIVIKKNAFTPEEALQWQTTCMRLPRGLPTATYLPCGMTSGNRSPIDKFLEDASGSPDRLMNYIRHAKYDIAPCTDDKPYFYKMSRGVPDDFLWLLAGTVLFNLLVVGLPMRFVKGKAADNTFRKITLPLMIFICIGIGFMILEVSLFQKLVLYLGSPTIALSILLSSVLVGMGTGSFVGRNMWGADIQKRLRVVSVAIVALGILLFVLSPVLLARMLAFELPLRAAASFVTILPLAFFLGIPFPSCIQLLSLGRNDRYIPWMYGVNGSMAVLGSVLAVILSMLFGFAVAYAVGLSFYGVVVVVSFSSWSNIHSGPAKA
jgi:spermidine synthase